MAQGGVGIAHDGVALARHMMGDEIHILVDLGTGGGIGHVIGIDLGPGYIQENSVTS